MLRMHRPDVAYAWPAMATPCSSTRRHSKREIGRMIFAEKPLMVKAKDRRCLSRLVFAFFRTNFER